MELPPFSLARDGWRGFIGPVPPPLWMQYLRIVATESGVRRRIRHVMPTTDEPFSPGHAEPASVTVRSPVRPRRAPLSARPSATSRASRSSRPPACAGSTSSARGRSTRRGCEERFEFHPLDYEDVFSRNQRPKVDEYDDYLFIVLHFPRYDKKVARLNAAELDLFVGPDYLITLQNEPLQAVEYLFERCRRQRGAARATCSPRARATCSTRSSTTASTPRSRCCARWATSSSASRRRSSRGRPARPRSCATSPTSSRRSSTSARSSGRSAPRFRDLERNKARYIAEDLDIYFDDINDASERVWDMLENYKEVVEGLESTNESPDRAPHQRDLPGADRDLA